MSRIIHTRGANPWHRDGRDPISKLRDQGRWEREIRRERFFTALRTWSLVSGIMAGAVAGLAIGAAWAMGLLQ